MGGKLVVLLYTLTNAPLGGHCTWHAATVRNANIITVEAVKWPRLYPTSSCYRYR